MPGSTREAQRLWRPFWVLCSGTPRVNGASKVDAHLREATRSMVVDLQWSLRSACLEARYPSTQNVREDASDLIPLHRYRTYPAVSSLLEQTSDKGEASIGAIEGHLAGDTARKTSRTACEVLRSKISSAVNRGVHLAAPRTRRPIAKVV